MGSQTTSTTVVAETTENFATEHDASGSMTTASSKLPAPIIKPGGRSNNADDGKNIGVQTSAEEDRIKNLKIELQILELRKQLQEQKRKLKNKRNKNQRRDKRADKSTLLYGNLQTTDDCASMPG